MIVPPVGFNCFSDYIVAENTHSRKSVTERLGKPLTRTQHGYMLGRRDDGNYRTTQRRNPTSFLVGLLLWVVSTDSEVHSPPIHTVLAGFFRVQGGVGI